MGKRHLFRVRPKYDEETKKYLEDNIIEAPSISSEQIVEITKQAVKDGVISEPTPRKKHEAMEFLAKLTSSLNPIGAARVNARVVKRLQNMKREFGNRPMGKDEFEKIVDEEITKYQMEHIR